MIPQPFVRKAHVLPAPHLVLSREPLSKPLRRVRVDRRVGWGDLAQAEVLRPAGHHPVQRSDYLFRGFQPMTSFGLLADLAADALDARLARSIPDIGIAAVRAVIPSELIASFSPSMSLLTAGSMSAAGAMPSTQKSSAYETISAPKCRAKPSCFQPRMKRRM